jgi:hypothetical protein
MYSENITDAELAETLDKPTQAIEKSSPQPTAAEALTKAIAPLAERAQEQTALAAKNLSDVLPAVFYEGAAELVLTEAQEAKLDKLSTPSDDDIDIRPDGLIYVGHSYHRRVLTEVFGRGGWAEVEASPVQLKRQGDAEWIYQRWALYVRGQNGQRVFIRSCVGSARWFGDSPRANFAETLESVRSDALPRNAAKGSLQIALEPWIKKLGQEWKRNYAVQVWANVKEFGKPVQKMLWRRKDADPLEGEIRLVEPEGQKKQPEAAQKVETPQLPPESAPQPTAIASAATPANSKAPAKAKTPAPAPKATTPEPATPLPPPDPNQAHPSHCTCLECLPPPKPQKDVSSTTAPAGGPQMVSEPQIRLFFALARRDKCKLIEGDNAGGAVLWLAEKVGTTPDQLEKMGSNGKKSSEVAINLLRRLPMKTFHEEILPALRKQYGL